MSGNWFAIIVFIITIGLVQLFKVYDWGFGVIRGILLLLLGILLFSMQFFPNRLKFSPGGLFPYVILTLLVLSAIFNLAFGIRTVERTSNTRHIELDQGQMSYRAVKYLFAGINPYGQSTMIDPLVYVIFIDKFQNRSECTNYSSKMMVERFTAFYNKPGGSAGNMESLFPEVAADESCKDVRRAFASLGYPYGPVTIASYAPFVMLFEEPGIYINHILLVSALVVVAFWIGRRMTRGNVILSSLPCLLILVPPHFRHNFLDLSASDLPAVVFALVFLALWMKGKYNFAAVALALSLGAKVMPGLLFVPLLLKSPFRMGFWMVLVLVAVFLPFVLWDAIGLFNNLSVATVSSSTDSTSLVHFISPSAAWVLKLVVFAGLIVLVVWNTRHQWTEVRALRYLAFANLGFLFSAPLIHNNYLTWLLPVLGFALISEIYGKRRTRALVKSKK